MKKLLSINIIFFTLIISFSATAQTEMGKVCKTFKGEEGVIITTARYGPDKNNEALIGVYAIDHSWAGKIFKAKVNSYNGKADYEISYKGKPYIIMTLRNNNYEIYLPKESNMQRSPLYVYYSEELSDNCTPNNFLKEFQEQGKSKK
jgi:DNA modification methylase